MIVNNPIVKTYGVLKKLSDNPSPGPSPENGEGNKSFAKTFSKNEHGCEIIR
jgi:hypothetical protein